jgi:hypothetical protein
MDSFYNLHREHPGDVYVSNRAMGEGRQAYSTSALASM